MSAKRVPTILARILSVSTILATLAFNLAARDEDNLSDRFAREYPRALERLRTAYHHFWGSGTETIARQAKGKSWTTISVIRLTFNVSGDSIRIDKENVNGQYTVESVNSKYAFRAQAPKKNGPLALKGLKENGSSLLARSIDQFRRDYLLAAFSVRVPIGDFLFDPTLTTIGRVFTVMREGRELVRVEYSRNYRFQGVPTKLNGWLILDPGNGWALVELSQSDEKGIHQLHTSIEYGSSNNGIPVPKEVLLQSNRERRLFSFEEISFEDTPDFAFSLSSIGLPEFEGSWKIFGMRWFWFFNLALALILLMIRLFFWAKSSRNENRDQSRQS